jgi:predicted PurR-regulated permease PerM
VQTFVAQFDDLSAQVSGGVDEVRTWLAQGPLHLSQQQLDDGLERLQASVTDNQGALTSGAVSTAATLGEVVAGFFVVLFTLFFFLRDGDEIWRFLCRLLPGDAQVPVARAGHYSWHTLVSYVRATVLVAFVDADWRCWVFRWRSRWPPWSSSARSSRSSAPPCPVPSRSWWRW